MGQMDASTSLKAKLLSLLSLCFSLIFLLVCCCHTLFFLRVSCAVIYKAVTLIECVS